MHLLRLEAGVGANDDGQGGVLGHLLPFPRPISREVEPISSLISLKAIPSSASSFRMEGSGNSVPTKRGFNLGRSTKSSASVLSKGWSPLHDKLRRCWKRLLGRHAVQKSCQTVTLFAFSSYRNQRENDPLIRPLGLYVCMASAAPSGMTDKIGCQSGCQLGNITVMATPFTRSRIFAELAKPR